LGGGEPPLADVEAVPDADALRVSLYSPRRTRLAIVAPSVDEATLKAGLEALHAPERVEDRREEVSWPRDVVYEAEGAHAHLGAVCAPGVRGARLEVLTEALRSRLHRELRERRGMVYGVSATTGRGPLVLATSTAPAYAAEVYQALGAIEADADDVARGVAEALGLASPASRRPSALARELAFGLLTTGDLVTWGTDTNSLDLPAALERCRATLRRHVTGPPGTAFPPGAERLTRATVAARTSGW
jgi:hypothetical protein